jgi:hypothetical protein
MVSAYHRRMRQKRIPPLVVLFWVVIADYAAQIPYYLVNYSIPHGSAPTLRSLVLLGMTLAWFLIGYFALLQGRRVGYWLLLSFLLIEGVFYLLTILFGAVAFQLDNHSWVNRIVFLIGYATGIVSLLYTVLLLVFRSRYLVEQHPPAQG